jgi:hypothetical protein
LFLLLDEPFDFRHVESQRLIVSNRDSIEQEIAILLHETPFKRRERILCNNVEMEVAQSHRARPVLDGYLTLDLDRSNLQRQYLLEAGAAT